MIAALKTAKWLDRSKGIIVLPTVKGGAYSAVLCMLDGFEKAVETAPL